MCRIGLCIKIWLYMVTWEMVWCCQFWKHWSPVLDVAPYPPKWSNWHYQSWPCYLLFWAYDPNSAKGATRADLGPGHGNPATALVQCITIHAGHIQKVVHLQKPASMDLGASSYYHHLGLYNVQTLLNLIFTFWKAQFRAQLLQSRAVKVTWSDQLVWVV